MTGCARCLGDLSTIRIGDMHAGSSAALHCESCPKCAGLAQEIAYAERRLSTALSEARSRFTAEELSQAALTGSERARRRQVGQRVRGLLGIAGCVAFWFFMEYTFIPRIDPGQHLPIETITLRCLTPEQASDLATPYLRGHGSAIYQTKGFKAIAIRGLPSEALQAAMKVRQLDEAARCGITDPPANAPKTTAATSSGTPKKD